MKKLALVIASILAAYNKRKTSEPGDQTKVVQMFKTNKVGKPLLTLDFTLN